MPMLSYDPGGVFLDGGVPLEQLQQLAPRLEAARRGGDSESESNRRGCAGPPWGPAIKKKARRHTAAKAGS